MTDKRNYRVSGKKLLPKPYNLRRNQAKKLGPDNDLAELEHTVAGTVWIRPNEKGGMTVMQPSEN